MRICLFFLALWSVTWAFVPSGQSSLSKSSNNAPAPTQTTSRSSSLLFSGPTDDNYNFMASLQKRMDQVQEKDTILPLVVLDSMLPRQVLNITVNNGLLMELIRQRLQDETPSFGMVGNARLADGRKVTLSSGVEVEIIGKPRVSDAGLHLSLKGTRRFRIDEKHVEKTESGWTQARVKFLNSTEDDRAELHPTRDESSTDDSSESTAAVDPMSLARAMQMAREFTDPNFSMAESQSLVEMWLELAREKERKPNQIDTLLQDLGPMPSWKSPTECAFWVGALINPIPALGVAMEIRPKLLVAKTAEERTQIALDALWNSIQHMEGANRFEQRKE